MSAYNSRRIVVVNAANLASMNTQLSSVDPTSSGVAISSPLVPVGTVGVATPSHYWCDWTLTSAQAAILDSQVSSFVQAGSAYSYDGLSYTPDQVLTILSLIRYIAPK